ncbi:alpha/beta hydrolase [Stappia sp. F7233]|uniref:Alpha/beta hydrolase n=1 Tax=Stappia albiluteola TaxID=2758565 RepID=A0A839A913_9HYPH|nr:alpha/beta hydrolase [Stappia albiluteola]MBA5775831.1 alpha/beta hydrolase [Stappia albiluteola]
MTLTDTACEGEEPAWTARQWRSRNGLRLSAREWFPAQGASAKPVPVLCLAGLSRNARDFAPLAARLAGEGYRVIAMDYRGRGASDRDPDWQNYSIPTEGDDIQLGLEAFGIAACAVVGTSRGGIHAMALAAQKPDLVRAIVLNDIGPKIEFEGLKRLSEIIGREMTAPSWEAAAARLRSLYADSFTGLSEGDWHRFARQLYVETDQGVVLDYDPALGNGLADLAPDSVPDLWPLFSSLKNIPQMLIRAENSDILSNATLEQARSLKPELEVLTVEGQGHAPLLWTATEQDAVASFLNRKIAT